MSGFSPVLTLIRIMLCTFLHYVSKTYTLVGGFSGLTWAQLNTHLSQSVECRIFALDLRGHGETILQNLEDESDLSAARLADDVLRVVDKLLGNY